MSTQEDPLPRREDEANTWPRAGFLVGTLNVTVVTETNSAARPRTRVVAVFDSPAGAEKYIDCQASRPMATSAWGHQEFPVLREWEAEAGS